MGVSTNLRDFCFCFRFRCRVHHSEQSEVLRDCPCWETVEGSVSAGRFPVPQRADGVVVAVVVAVAAAAAAWCDSLLLLCSVIVSHQHEGFEVPQHPDGPEPNDE